MDLVVEEQIGGGMVGEGRDFTPSLEDLLLITYYTSYYRLLHIMQLQSYSRYLS